MASREAKSESSRRVSVYPNGIKEELVSTDGEPTKVFVLSNDRFRESVMLQSGDFFMHAIKISNEPIAMVTCQVGNHTWALAKDLMVFQVGARVFVFVFSDDIIYGLILPERCSDYERKEIENMLMKYSAYQCISDSGTTDSGPEVDIWVSVFVKIQEVVDPRAAKESMANLTPETAGASSSEIAGSKPPCGTRLLEGEVYRARRMSAAVNLVARLLISGALNRATHLQMVMPRETPTSSGTIDEDATPTIHAIFDLLETIDCYHKGEDPPLVGPWTYPRQKDRSYWYINPAGLKLMVDIGFLEEPGVNAARVENSHATIDCQVEIGTEAAGARLLRKRKR